MTRTLETDADRLYERIVTEVAARNDADPTELPPLFDVVDPDALSAVFAPTEGGATRAGRVEFSYAGYDITVVFDDGPDFRID